MCIKNYTALVYILESSWWRSYWDGLMNSLNVCISLSHLCVCLGGCRNSFSTCARRKNVQTNKKQLDEWLVCGGTCEMYRQEKRVKTCNTCAVKITNRCYIVCVRKGVYFLVIALYSSKNTNPCDSNPSKSTQNMKISYRYTKKETWKSFITSSFIYHNFHIFCMSLLFSLPSFHEYYFLVEAVMCGFKFFCCYHGEIAQYNEKCLRVYA